MARVSRAERDRLEAGFAAAMEHREATSHSVLRCGGTWACLDCSAGNSQRAIEARLEEARR